MHDLVWILAGSALMSSLAMVGSLTTVLRRETLARLLLPMVSLAAGTLIGGAFFHMIPEGSRGMDPRQAAVWLVGGFAAFLALEQFMHWHHSHQPEEVEVKKPVTYLILLGDAAHNFLGGLGIAGTFLIDPRAGIVAWFAAVAHEIPQELGDFGILVHGGWSRRQALLWNFVSALTFPVGAVVAYVVARHVDVSGLVLFAAGNFLYIAASDLIPEIKAEPAPRSAFLHFSLFLAGLALMLLIAAGLHGIG